jgi:predicted HTH transcriptional regulator
MSSHTLNEDRLAELEKLVLEFMCDHETITNRKLREISSINYDQAIYFFNRMIEKGTLKRIGVSSGIKYVLP